MTIDLTPQLAFYHLEIVLFALLIALIVGGGLGYLIAILLRDWVQRSSGFRSVLVIFPWRSLAAWIALVLSQSSLVIMQFGLGFPADALTIAGVLLVFIIPWVVQTILGSFFQRSGFGKLLAFSRTLAILSIAFAVVLHFGLGNYMDWAYSNLDDQRIKSGYIILGIMMISLDVLFGFTQLLVARMKSKPMIEKSF